MERAEQRTGTGGGPEAMGVEGMCVGNGAGGKGGAGGAGGAGGHALGPLKSAARVWEPRSRGLGNHGAMGSGTTRGQQAKRTAGGRSHDGTMSI